MGFNKVDRALKPWSIIQEVRFLVRQAPNYTLTGKITVPGSIVSQLGWTNNMCLDVHIGDGDDLGWFLLKPAASGEKHRARLKVHRNGVGCYTTKALVAEGVDAPKHSYTPETRIDQENGVFLVKP